MKIFALIHHCMWSAVCINIWIFKYCTFGLGGLEELNLRLVIQLQTGRQMRRRQRVHMNLIIILEHKSANYIECLVQPNIWQHNHHYLMVSTAPMSSCSQTSRSGARARILMSMTRAANEPSANHNHGEGEKDPTRAFSRMKDTFKTLLSVKTWW